MANRVGSGPDASVFGCCLPPLPKRRRNFHFLRRLSQRSRERSVSGGSFRLGEDPPISAALSQPPRSCLLQPRFSGPPLRRRQRSSSSLVVDNDNISLSSHSSISSLAVSLAPQPQPSLPRRGSLDSLNSHSSSRSISTRSVSFAEDNSEVSLIVQWQTRAIVQRLRQLQHTKAQLQRQQQQEQLVAGTQEGNNDNGENASNGQLELAAAGVDFEDLSWQQVYQYCFQVLSLAYLWHWVVRRVPVLNHSKNKTSSQAPSSRSSGINASSQNNNRSNRALPTIPETNASATVSAANDSKTQTNKGVSQAPFSS